MLQLLCQSFSTEMKQNKSSLFFRDSQMRLLTPNQQFQSTLLKRDQWGSQPEFLLWDFGSHGMGEIKVTVLCCTDLPRSRNENVRDAAHRTRMRGRNGRPRPESRVGILGEGGSGSLPHQLEGLGER